MVAVNKFFIISFFFRSQKTNTLQREEGLFIQQHGASGDVIHSGRILGFSSSIRDVDGQKSRLLREQPDFVHHQISNALQVSSKYSLNLKAVPSKYCKIKTSPISSSVFSVQWTNTSKGKQWSM